MERRIVLVSGAPGAGKSTIALDLAAILGLPLLAKDLIKERIWDALDPPEGDREWSRRTGAAAMEVLWSLAAHAPAAVLEANFRPASEYEQGRLRALGGRVVEVYCWCPPEEARRRYAARARGPGHHRAHVTPTLDPGLLAEFDRPMGIGTLLHVDTSGPVDVVALADEVAELFAEPITRFDRPKEPEV